jgi:type VI secretion system secreted protein VgrG
MNASSDFIQAERILRIETPLGEDQLLAEKLSVREEVSGLFEARVAVRSKIPDLAPEMLLGKTVDVSVELGAGERRTWNALVTDMIAGPPITRGLRSYQLVLRPELWLLSQTSDCRIWMDKTALDVADTLLSEHGLASPDTSGVAEPPPSQHYSVQFNETDLAYLVRRLEEDGLFYWFQHEAGSHKLHIASHASGYTGGEDVRYAAGSTDRNHISRFVTTFSYTPGVHTGADWNFQAPSNVPGGGAPSLVSLPRNAAYEHYRYPMQAGYGSGSRASEGIEDGAVERVAKLRMQATEADHCRVEGASTVRTLAAGQRFKPFDVANPDNSFDEHVILAIEHEAVDTSYESVGNQPEYTNRFLALPATVPATPHPVTPHPRVEGAQIAVIAGPPGEEIHPDEFGRVKVWFPWDRRAKKDGSDTCWIRVGQSWAGTGFGAQVIPRIGMEVLVSYLDGDLDKPVITGLVPNTAQKVPYDLPANKTRAVMRSNTHKGSGFNELTFEDATGQENMFLHAQKDQTIRVLHDRVDRIDRHDVRSVGQNRIATIGNNHKTEVGGSMNTVVGGTGVSALALMAAVNGLAGHTSGLISQALEVAGAGSAGGGLFAGTVGGSVLGFLTGGGLSGFAGMTSGASNRGDAGTALTASGSQLGESGDSLFPLPGIMNTIVGSFRSDTIGVAAAEQIGTSKVVNVGATYLESTGKFRKIAVGEEFVIECGDSKLVMKANGEILILGKTFNFIATDHFQMRGKPIDLN